MNLSRNAIVAAMIGSAFAATHALAAEPGFFVGASGGSTTAKVEGEVDVDGIPTTIDFDEDETGYKAYIGYNFTPWLGVEGGYIVLGQPQQDYTFADSDVEAEIDATGWQGFLVGTLPLGPFDIFGKIGAIASSIDLDVDVATPGLPTERFSDEESSSMMAYGGGVAYNFGHWAIRAEYEAYDTDTLDDLYFVSGGLTYTFFRDEPAPAPVAAPAPARTPTVAATQAKCPDGDGDGVCDTADQCPTTPPGSRVSPGGCDCDYVLQLDFPFDSAELHADDIAKIDEIVPVLKNPNVAFIAGEVSGYTDSTGEDAYNVDLSKRRAEAVANYMRSKGVQLGDRFAINGYGEAHPIASNDTADGRAQNRRVVLRRTDCGPAH